MINIITFDRETVSRSFFTEVENMKFLNAGKCGRLQDWMQLSKRI